MNTYKAVIADDEPAAVKVITTLLRQLAPDVAIVGTACDGLEAIQVIKQSDPDIVFMDVNMPAMNGIQIAEKLSGTNLQLIFTTGSAEYALKALKLKASDYLLKPIDPGEFALAVADAKAQTDKQKEKRLELITVSRLQLPTQNEIVFLDQTDVTHVAGMGSYCHVHTVTGEKILVSRNIGHIEQKLNPTMFFRCHNSHIVNLDLIAKYHHRDGCFVEMKNGVLIEVSRRSKDKLLEALSARAR